MRKMILAVAVGLLVCAGQVFGAGDALLKPGSIAISKSNDIYVLSSSNIIRYKNNNPPAKIVNAKANDIYGDQNNKTGAKHVGVIAYEKGKRTGVGKDIEASDIIDFAKYLDCQPVLDSVINKIIYPSRITMGPDGNILAAGKDLFKEKAVLGIIDPNDGHPIKTFNVGGSRESDLNQPQGLATDKDSNCYVTDYWDDKVKVFNAKGEFVRSFGGNGGKDGQFKAIEAIAVDDKNGFVYVTDCYYPTMFRGNPYEGSQMRVQKFTLDGNFIIKWGSRTYTGIGGWPPHFTYDYELDEPRGIALDRAGNVYILCSYTNEVKKYTGEGKLLAKWGKGGKGPGEMFLPKAITVDNENNVYVADTENDRILKFDQNGKYLREIK